MCIFFMLNKYFEKYFLNQKKFIIFLVFFNYVPQTKFGRHIVFAPFLIIMDN